MTKFEQVMTQIVGGVLLATFLGVVLAAIWAARYPPRMADVAPTAPPELICPQASASERSPEPPESPTPADGSESPTSAETSPPSATASPDVVVVCKADKLQYAPQFRGSYDITARLTALLAIVTPLITTIVGFYFGHRAGAGEGKAAASDATATHALSIVALTQKAAALPDGPEKDELIQSLEAQRQTLAN